MNEEVEERRSKLAAEVRELLEFIDEAPSQDDISVPELRGVLFDRDTSFFLRGGSTPPEVGSVDERRVAVEGGEITVRFYRPSGEGPHPAFVHCHGGGFVFGSIDLLFYDFKCREICRGCSCIVVGVDYRLAPEYKFPAAPEDCFAALRYVAEHADELGIDPRRIAIGGDSAGGNLAAAVALMSRDRGGPQLALQVLEIPVIDNAEPENYPSWVQYGKGYGLEDDLGDMTLNEYFADAADAFSPYASPIRADDLTGLAPAHVMTAEFDILRDSGEAYGKKLQDASVPTTIDRHEGHIHGDVVLFRTWKPARMWMDEIIERLNAAFASDS